MRFALTSEAGLNDGLAFPFAHAAIFLAGSASIGQWGWHFLDWNLVGKIVIGVVVGVGVGWLLARIAFRSRSESLRVAERGDPLPALAVLLLFYGCSEVAGGYRFLAVFCAAVTMRAPNAGTSTTPPCTRWWSGCARHVGHPDHGLAGSAPGAAGNLSYHAGFYSTPIRRSRGSTSSPYSSRKRGWSAPGAWNTRWLNPRSR